MCWEYANLVLKNIYSEMITVLCLFVSHSVQSFAKKIRENIRSTQTFMASDEGNIEQCSKQVLSDCQVTVEAVKTGLEIGNYCRSAPFKISLVF